MSVMLTNLYLFQRKYSENIVKYYYYYLNCTLISI